MQTSFSIRRNTKRIFGRNRRRKFFLSQHFGHFTVPPPNSSSLQRIEQKVFCIESVWFLRLKLSSDWVSIRHLGECVKGFDQANKVSQIPIPKPNFEIGFTKAKDEQFSHCYKDIAEHLNRQIRISFRFEKNKTCVFSVKRFEHYGDQFVFILQKLSTWVTAKSKISTRIDFWLLKGVTFLRAITMCSAFTPDCGYDNSTIIFIGDV